MIIANGFPKTGNHALVKACELLGIPTEGVQHIPYAEKEPGKRYTVIVRDPRNVVISMIRFRGKQVTPGTFLSCFRKFEDAPLIAEMDKFAGWLTDPAVHVVRYEDLIRDDRTMRDLAKWVGVRYIPGAWEGLPGLTMTWNAEHSDYRAIWTQVQDSWERAGGGELLRTWGY